jgi:hypothetical protein
MGHRRTSPPPWIQTCSQMCFRLMFDSTGCRLSPPVDVLVRLKIKTSGEGGSVSVEGETSGQFACLARELRLWTFSPALRRGTPVESQVEVLVHSHSKEALPSDSCATVPSVKDAPVIQIVLRLHEVHHRRTRRGALSKELRCETVRSRELYRER